MSSILSRRSGAAFFWDESFLWGIMARRALQKAGLPFDLIRAEDIRKGRLDPYTLLFVPGGWSSNKRKTLGEKGAEAVRNFVASGGSYLGFCGGAGLATLDGIGLLNIRRKPTSERVPSFSGRIRLKTSKHAMWKGMRQPVFHAWWPPQFTLMDDSAKVLATYQDALPDSFSSDLNTGDIEAAGNWQELEALYRINLDPKRLLNDPAVVTGSHGKGKVVLSLLHFDTPDDAGGRRVLKNLWSMLSRDATPSAMLRTQGKTASLKRTSPHDELLHACCSTVNGLIEHGIRNFLWYWRTPFLLQWRRGVRGIEYCTLSVMIDEISKALAQDRIIEEGLIRAKLEAILPRLEYFTENAKNLLTRERFAMQNGHITYERCDDPEIRRLREELFSSSKSYGGLFKDLIDSIDDLLYLLFVSRA
ncbi:MAG: BPL-N domain-containing protein [Nitrospirota bacterium]|nr:BPL-N domain-containing protein [Nitrospirota bacterium]